ADVDRSVLDVPFERYLYPRALDVISHLWENGEPAILSDGDRVYQPMKIERSGLLLAVRGNVLVYEHKEDHLAEVQRRFPASRYAHIDDKAVLRPKSQTARRPTSSSTGSPISWLSRASVSRARSLGLVQRAPGEVVRKLVGVSQPAAQRSQEGGRDLRVLHEDESHDRRVDLKGLRVLERGHR